jgi:predicted transcriptional regulator
MSSNLAEKAKLARVLSGPTLPFEPGQVSVVRIRQADFARLMGVTRPAVCQWVRSGRITTNLDGTLDPNRAVAELLRTVDMKTARPKVLHVIRAEIEEAHERAAQAVAERDRCIQHLDELRAALRLVTRRWLEAETWLNGFEAAVQEAIAIPDDVRDQIREQTLEVALSAPLADLSAGKDPELLALLRTLDPGCGLPPAGDSSTPGEGAAADPLASDPKGQTDELNLE